MSFIIKRRINILNTSSTAVWTFKIFFPKKNTNYFETLHQKERCIFLGWCCLKHKYFKRVQLHYRDIAMMSDDVHRASDNELTFTILRVIFSFISHHHQPSRIFFLLSLHFQLDFNVILSHRSQPPVLFVYLFCLFFSLIYYYFF